VRRDHHLFEADGERLLELLARAGAEEGKGLKSGVWKLPSLPDLEMRIGGRRPDGVAKQVQSVIPPTPGTDGKARRWGGVETVARLPEAAYAYLEQLGAGPLIRRSADAAGCSRRGVAAKDADNVEARAIAYLATCEPAISGQRGHDKTFGVACRVGPGFDLRPEVALRLLAAHYNPQCLPPWSANELRHKVEDAYKIESRRGWFLANDQSPHFNGLRQDNTAPKMHPGPDLATHEEAQDTHAGKLIHVWQKSEPGPCVAAEGPAQPCVAALPEEVQEAVRKHACFENPARWPEALFKVRRELDPVAKERAWDLEVWKAVAAYWIAACRWNGQYVPGFDSVWAQFKKMLETTIKQPIGETLARVEARIPHVIVPPELAAHPRLVALARVMIALAEENALCGRTEFYASLRDIGKLAGGMEARTVQRRLGALSAEGYLSMPKAGTQGTRRGGKANTWIWHDPPLPGATVWDDSNMASKRKECDGVPRVARTGNGPA
jgi:hypothetical protein